MSSPSSAMQSPPASSASASATGSRRGSEASEKMVKVVDGPAATAPGSGVDAESAMGGVMDDDGSDDEMLDDESGF